MAGKAWVQLKFADLKPIAEHLKLTWEPNWGHVDALVSMTLEQNKVSELEALEIEMSKTQPLFCPRDSKEIVKSIH